MSLPSPPAKLLAAAARVAPARGLVVPAGQRAEQPQSLRLARAPPGHKG